jgi:hypothetical protein
MPELPGSNRRVLKATYVPLKVQVPKGTPGAAVQKYAYVRRLSLQQGDLAAVRKSLPAQTRSQGMRQLLAKLAPFEGSPLPSQLPPLDAFAKTNTNDLLAFGKALSSIRREQLAQPSAAKTVKAMKNAAQALPATQSADSQVLALSLLNTSLAATTALAQGSSATPIGMLNLERLEMVPAGIQRGELIATIPLAPLEQTSVVQKEWSVTSQEFTSIVTDSLDNYSETGVTENTELAQSTTSQNQHSNQFNVNATVSGNVNFATIYSAQASATSGFTSQDQNSASATASTTHALTTTKKASTRVKQEHKVTISTSTVAGTSETTTRSLQNPSATASMRIDYFSLMRKWHVSLYRYGLRLTYDLVIPEPGATLRQQYQTLASLKAQAAQGFVFNMPYSAITPDTYQGLAASNQAQVPPPPTVSPTSTYTNTPKTGKGWFYCDIPIAVADGSWITDVSIVLNLGQIDSGTKVGFDVINAAWSPTGFNAGEYSRDLTQVNNYMLHYTGNQTVSILLIDVNDSTAHVTVTVTTAPTSDTMAQWQANVWNALYNAAQTTFYATQQLVQSQIQDLEDQLTGVDTLTLRREENDEITKCVLRWLLGPGFDFMPPSVSSLFPNAAGAAWGIGFPTDPPNALGLSVSDWSVVMLYEQMVRFVNDAIDWDNILYFLYSYFWDVPAAWENIRKIQHPDATRQAFLRAGSARVVLTVRKGWETAWVQFVEGGQFGTDALPELHPYLAIAQEIQDYDNTNYPGIPPANPGGAPLPDDDDYVATVANSAVTASAGPVSLNVSSSDGFIVGYTVIIDSYESGVQETQMIVAVPDATHITVSSLTNAHGAGESNFAVIQAGEKGLLIAEWFEYTPNSGTDIAVSSDLTTIA